MALLGAPAAFAGTALGAVANAVASAGPSEDGGFEELREFSCNCSCRSAVLVSIWKIRWTSVSITSWQAFSVAGFGASGCLPTGEASKAERFTASISMKIGAFQATITYLGVFLMTAATMSYPGG